MQLIRSRFRGDRHLSSATASKFRRIRAGKDLHFLDRIQYRAKREIVDGWVVVIQTIKNVAVCSFPGAGRIEAASKTERGGRRCRYGSWNQLRQRLELPPVEWQFHHLLIVDQI